MIMIVLLNRQKNKGIFKIGIHIRLIFKEGSWLIEIAFIESPCMGQSDSEYEESNVFAVM